MTLPMPYQAIREFLSSVGIGVARMHYDFAVDGGAIGLITPAQSDFVPANAVLLGGVVVPTTTLTSGGAATVALGGAGLAANGLLTAQAKTVYAVATLTALIPTFAVPLLAVGGKLNLTVAVATVTAGAFDVLVFYALPSNS